MTFTSTGGQFPHRDCLHVLITLVFFPGETAKDFEVKGSVYGKTLEATRFNTYAGKSVRPTTYDIPPEGRAHLYASEWPGLFYAVKRDPYFQRYDCTCEQPYCEHIQHFRTLR